MKAQEIRKKSEKELISLLEELREKVRSLRFKTRSREVKNYNLLREAKKEIARILTIKKERKHGLEIRAA